MTLQRAAATTSICGGRRSSSKRTVTVDGAEKRHEYKKAKGKVKVLTGVIILSGVATAQIKRSCVKFKLAVLCCDQRAMPNNANCKQDRVGVRNSL